MTLREFKQLSNKCIPNMIKSNCFKSIFYKLRRSDVSKYNRSINPFSNTRGVRVLASKFVSTLNSGFKLI